jgi:hypothetical protein
MSIIKRVILSEKKGAISDLILDEILRLYIILNFERLPNLYIGFNTQD